MKLRDTIDALGIKLGNAENIEAATGCTVIICEKGAVAGVDVRGGAPGTRETDLLNPINLVDKVHGILLSGGSAFGLDAASGVMRFLRERDIGLDVGVAKVPIVPGAVLFDLNLGDSKVYPDSSMGYQACVNAYEGSFHLGNRGAGTGASVGKVSGLEKAMKGGLGSSCIKVGELYLGALVAVNCFGDVINPKNQQIVAGALGGDGKSFLDTEKFIINNLTRSNNAFMSNTTIGVVFTNAILNKAQGTKVASMAHNGYARTIRPAHTMFDGDTIFTMATNQVEADITALGILAARMIEEAVLNGVEEASRAYGLMAASDMKK